MTPTWEPVTVVKAGSYPLKASLDPNVPNQPYIKPPYSIGMAFAFLSDSEITSPERPEGDRRGLPSKECAIGGTVLVGAGGGEDWHEHMEYYDITLYVEAGALEIGIRDGGEHGAETIVQAGPGDFVRIPPHAWHYWLNKGGSETKLVWFAHFHDRTAA
jgi:quercetin dioxygenase-like cupin family protein